MALTVEAVKARVETDLDDATLATILTGCVAEIDRAAGAVDVETETFRASGARFVALSRPSTGITTVTERFSVDADPVTLVDGTDFRKVGDYELLRLGGLRWGAEIVVTYTPEVDVELRDSVTLDLCQMTVEFRALDKESVGDWSGEQADFESRRAALLAKVREGRSPIL